MEGGGWGEGRGPQQGGRWDTGQGRAEAAPAWGLTPFEDQQLAGLLMWVPGGIIYAGAALMMMAAWISRSSKRGGYDSHAPAV